MEWVGEVNSRVGDRVTACGDVDQDGVSDFAFSEFGDLDGARDRRRVVVMSGRTRTRLLEIESPENARDFGASLALGQPRAGEDLPLLLVGAPGWRTDLSGPQTGAVYVYSLRSRSLVRVLQSSAVDDRFGASICSVGDSNGDGIEDLIVGAPGDGWQDRPDRLDCVSSGDGRVLYSVRGNDSDGVGRNNHTVKDLDGDDVLDFASLTNDYEIQLFSGAKGQRMATVRRGGLEATMVRSAAANPAGAMAIYVPNFGLRSRNEVYELYPDATGVASVSFRVSGADGAVASDEHSNPLFLATTGKQLRVYSVSDGDELAEWAIEGSTRAVIYAIGDITADGVEDFVCLIPAKPGGVDKKGRMILVGRVKVE